MKKTCQSCKLFNSNGAVCRLTGRKVDPMTDFCSSRQGEIVQCELCRNITLKPTWTFGAGEWHGLCTECATKRLNTCFLCRNAPRCAFEQDPNPLPKFVIQQQRTPMGIMQAQVKNPARIEALCHRCPCWDEEKSCMREYEYCNNLSHKWPNPDQEIVSTSAEDVTNPETANS